MVHFILSYYRQKINEIRLEGVDRFMHTGNHKRQVESR